MIPPSDAQGWARSCNYGAIGDRFIVCCAVLKTGPLKAFQNTLRDHRHEIAKTIEQIDQGINLVRSPGNDLDQMRFASPESMLGSSMDLRIIREHLAQAERHLALSDRHIGRQIEIIDELERDGHPTALALEVLATYRAVHATYLVHHETIRKELEQ